MSSAAGDGLPSVDFQRSLTSAALNSTLLFVLFMGMYTIILLGTIYVYTNQKTGPNRVIVASLSALYAVTLANLCIQWLVMNQIFIGNGDSRLSEFIYIEVGDGAEAVAAATVQSAGYILADGLLLWRCFHMVGPSVFWMVIPSFFYISEIVLSIASVIIGGIVELHPNSQTLKTERAEDIVSGALASVTAATSLSATFVICWRIVTSSRDSAVVGKGRYKRIIQMLIQSAVLYSISGVVYAISSILTVFQTQSLVYVSDVMIQYAATLNVMMTGIAPTLMVAQISLSTGLSSTEVDKSNHLSILQFQGKTTTNNSAHDTGHDFSHMSASPNQKEGLAEVV